MSKSSILLIYTGGTIGMMKDPETGALRPFNFSNISNQMPELKQFKFEIDTIEFSPLIDSSDANGEFWIKLVNIIKENYGKYDGFVILHGTDTMAYTASALSFMLEDLYKPVILTGSQLPIGTLRTDGKENLITSLEIAAAKQNGKAIVPEVCICFESKLYRGNRTTKHNAEHFDAFKSYNYPNLAEAGININYNLKSIHYPEHKKLLKVYDKLDNNVAILQIFPNISPKVVNSIINIENLKALIIETYGSGNAMTDKWFLESMKLAIDKGIIVLNVTQCKAGSVNMGTYETSADLLKFGVINGYDITIEAAVAKLMFLLGQNISTDEIKMYLNTSIAGEITI